MMASPTEKLTSQHPLQRLSSPSRTFSAIIHILGIISFTLSYRFLHDFPTIINDSYGWHWQYLTILGLTVAHATFIFGLLADITLSPQLFRIKNTLSLCSAPLEVLVSILYWTICAIDKSLLLPPGVTIAPVADLGFHLAPSVFLVIDLLLLSPPWTIKAAPAMALSTLLAVGYWAWIERCFKFNGFYPYPLFEKLDTTQRSILFGGAALLMTGSTVMLKWVYGKVNGTHGEERRSRPGNVKGEKGL